MGILHDRRGVAERSLGHPLFGKKSLELQSGFR